MPRIRLTQKAIAKLSAPHPDGKQTIYWCDELRGFGVQCSGRTNQKMFVVQRDLPSGTTRRVSIGPVSGLALRIARSRAEEALDQLRKDIDPKRKIVTFTLRKALDGYVAARPNLAPASIKLYRVVERILDSWLDLDLNEVTPDMIENKHRAIAAEIGKSTANLMMRIFGILWNFAAERAQLPPKSPVLRLRRQWYAEPRRTRRVSNDQLPEFYKAVCALPNRVARDYILLMLFTGFRRGEASNLKWADIDLSEKIICVPADVTKSKRKLEVPMSNFVHDLLVTRRALGITGQYIFPGSGRSGHITSPLNALAAVAETTGIRVSAHDLRRTYSSVVDSLDVSWMATKALLNHATGKDVTEGYIEMTVPRLRKPVQDISDKLLSLCQFAPVVAKNVRRLKP